MGHARLVGQLRFSTRGEGMPDMCRRCCWAMLRGCQATLVGRAGSYVFPPFGAVIPNISRSCRWAIPGCQPAWVVPPGITVCSPVVPARPSICGRLPTR